MSSAINRHKLIDRLKSLVLDNKRNIFDNADDGFRIIRFSVSRPLHRREDRYHQILKVTYTTSNGLYRKKLWLKYRNDFEALYKIHTMVYEQLQNKHRFLPKPYFYGTWDQSSVVGMEFVKGAPLRNVVLRSIACGRTAMLEQVFLQMGRAMRVFHDLSAVSGVRRIGELAENARSVTSGTEYLSDEERKQIIRHIETAERSANSQTELALIKIHNDWVLRNILVGNTDSFHIVDLDSMRAPCNSRWYDVSYFLINLESQLKYWPLINQKSIIALWESFWQGYSEKGLPDALSSNQIRALIYLIKIQYLFGATIRPPLFKVYKSFLGPLYLRNLKKSLVQGQCSTLAVEL